MESQYNDKFVSKKVSSFILIYLPSAQDTPEGSGQTRVGARKCDIMKVQSEEIVRRNAQRNQLTASNERSNIL